METKYKVDEYYDGSDQRPKGTFKISPSSIEKFFSRNENGMVRTY